MLLHICISITHMLHNNTNTFLTPLYCFVARSAPCLGWPRQTGTAKTHGWVHSLRRFGCCNFLYGRALTCWRIFHGIIWWIFYSRSDTVSLNICGSFWIFCVFFLTPFVRAWQALHKLLVPLVDVYLVDSRDIRPLHPCWLCHVCQTLWASFIMLEAVSATQSGHSIGFRLRFQFSAGFFWWPALHSTHDESMMSPWLLEECLSSKRSTWPASGALLSFRCECGEFQLWLSECFIRFLKSLGNDKEQLLSYLFIFYKHNIIYHVFLHFLTPKYRVFLWFPLNI